MQTRFSQENNNRIEFIKRSCYSSIDRVPFLKRYTVSQVSQIRFRTDSLYLNSYTQMDTSRYFEIKFPKKSQDAAVDSLTLLVSPFRESIFVIRCDEENTDGEYRGGETGRNWISSCWPRVNWGCFAPCGRGRSPS